MNIQKRQQKKEQSTRKLKHKIDHNTIIFTLECQNLLRVSVYDERRVTQIYEGVFYGDCLPNDAKIVFQSISQLFEFLEMNFAAMVSIKQMEAIVVDMNKIRIPCKFQLPFIVQAYPVVQDVIVTLQTQNQELNKELVSKNQELEKAKEYINRVQGKLEKGEKDLVAKTQMLDHQTNLRRSAQIQIQQLKTKLVQTKQNCECLLSQALTKSRFYQENAAKCCQKNQQLNERLQLLTKQLNSMEEVAKKKQCVIKQLQEQNEKLKQQLDLSNSRNLNSSNDKVKNQDSADRQKSIDQIISQFEPKQYQNKSPQKSISPQKKSNPFITGLFIKKTLGLKAPSPFGLKHQSSSLKPANSPPSRFHKLLEFQSSGECSLNLTTSMNKKGKRLFKDIDIDELIKYDWPDVCRLNLSQNIITGKGLQTLLDIPWPELKSLSLSSNKISEFNLTRPNFAVKTPKLILIDLNFNPISNETHTEIIKHNKSGKQPKMLVTVQRKEGQSFLSFPRFFSATSGFK